MSELDGSAFDFWLGDWECAFDGGQAANSITCGFDGHVLTERFEITAPQPWSGMSVSVYNSAQDVWRQTWVDQGGSYWHFVGSRVDGDPCFGTPEPVDADPLFKRMVFSNIAGDSFDWRWESSPDGNEWTENWAIKYTRK